MLATSVTAAETILITGANRGIGLEFARQYAAKEWHVVATHRRDEIPETLAALAAEHGNVQVETLDVNNPGHLAALVARLDGMPIDVLLNNAAVMGIS
ncbi:MAG: SDR family NAD(P)-dependent oxidoreductase, partial [Gammaproteobacteria bacterium]|nr:SDR family NAD(P)-dependent oxidoreductase [Gammaproteobacteria bacterium]